MSKIELIELPSEKITITTEIASSSSTYHSSSWPLMTSSSSSESKNNDHFLQETVEIPFASTESDIITKINSEYVNTDHVNPHHDGNL